MHADHEYLAAGYVLGGLAPDESELAESLYETDPDFRAEVASFAETMAAVAEADEPVTPSAQTEAAILGIPHASRHAAVGESHSPAGRGEAAPRRARPGRGRLTQTMLALAASTLLIVAAVLGTLLLHQVQQVHEIEASLTAAEQEREQLAQLLGAPDLAAAHVESAAGGSVTVTYSMNAQMMHVVPHDVPSPSSEESMQMWLIDEEGPHSLGLMSAEEPEMLSAVGLAEGVAFGVTIEPSGGSPEPTDDPIIVAEL
ncbi:anti-sigma factor [Nesterenkonia sphaerica]|uniref:Regulator of SigK n=1 Tax=Nesterenkonia sphaerica TaxID=1804988 RepID=A0A5R9A6H5_9MICC|nr:anti-sigma factor [Nesterenkonia sphaerica]TLP74208.1 anti-sigma factor [Nesterenkonia sphaerica]